MKTVSCPSCSAPVEWSPSSQYRPFCSERCKYLDLGAWANDEYRIPNATPPDGDDSALQQLLDRGN